MVFDLKAATHAALTEAQAAPFDFEYDGEKFTLCNVNEWPIDVQRGFLELNEAPGDATAPANARKALDLLADIVDSDDWDRFRRVVPMGAVPTLINQMSKQMVGVAVMADTRSMAQQRG
jgi:hypothetical protein